MVLVIFASEPRSSFKIDGGFARVNPVPTTCHSFLSNAVTTCRPSRPVAPVMRAVLVIAMFSCVVGSSKWEAGNYDV